MQLKLWRIASLAALNLSAVFSGCGWDQRSTSAAGATSEQLLASSRGYLYEREFAQAPALAAGATQTVVLDLEPATVQGSLVENISRHQLSEGEHKFCLGQNDPYLRRLVLEDIDGTVRVTLDRSSGCVTAVLPAGVYRMRVAHDGSAIVGAHRVAFVQSGNISVPLDDGFGNPVGGWWAMRPDPSADPSKRLGRVAAPPPTIVLVPYFYPQVQLVISDFANKQIDGNALFIFKPAHGSFDPNNTARPRLFSGDFPLNVAVNGLSDGGVLLVADLSGWTLANPTNAYPLTITDRGNNKGFFGIDIGNIGTNQPFDLDSKFRWSLDAFTNPAMIQLLFRFYPDGMIDPLRQGEVALFQQCNYGGKATVFAIDAASFTELNSSVVTLDQTTASIRLSNDTAVTLYPDAQFGGTPQIVKVDTPCLDGTPIGRNTRSIQVEPLTSVYLASSQSCVSCKLEGVDLSNADLSGTNLQNADLSGATLAKTKLHNAANLTKTNFSGAKLYCTDFSGTDDSHRVDLTQTVFSNAQYTTDFSCRASFAWTRITPQVLVPTVWRYLDLSNAAITGLSAPLSSQARPLDLSRAMLVGASLPGAVLDYATGLPNADLSGVVLTGGSLKNVNLSGTTLNGTQFDHVEATGAILTGALLQKANVQGIVLDGATGFAGANLTQVVLSGASLQGVDFTGAQLAGAKLDGAKLKGAKLDRATGLAQATLTGIDVSYASFVGTPLAGVSFQQGTLDSATGLAGPNGASVDLSGAFFNNASLKNVNLANALLYGANFTNANLENVNLAGAFLTANASANPPLRDPANFTGAHLKNANLIGAKLTGTIFNNASFYSSFNGNTPTYPCVTDITQCKKATPATGYTCSCATAVGATLTDTRFNNAYLYGVDFGGSTTTINGVSFNGAILVGANFSGANFNVDPTKSSPPDFSFAYLQGAILAGTNLTSTSLSGAFVDFGSPTNPQKGNILQILLGPAYTAFKGWEAPNLPVCVQAAYGSFTTVPTTIPTMTCPDGNILPGSGCGPTQASNTHWKSGTPISQASPPGFYQFDPTYGKADQSNACNGGTYNTDW